MIIGINSTSSAMSMMRSGSMGHQPPPPDKDVFQAADADGDGLVSKTELNTLTSGLEEITGNSIDPDDALTRFDVDEDGVLSGEELQGLMSVSGFSLSGASNDENGQTQGMRPPPPPPSKEVLSAYANNTDEVNIEQLIAFLKEQNGDDLGLSSIDVIS